MTDKRATLRDFSRIALVGASLAAIPLAGCQTQVPAAKPELKPRARAEQALYKALPETPPRRDRPRRFASGY